MSVSDPQWTEVVQTQSLQLRAILGAGKDMAVSQRCFVWPWHQALWESCRWFSYRQGGRECTPNCNKQIYHIWWTAHEQCTRFQHWILSKFYPLVMMNDYVVNVWIQSSVQNCNNHSFLSLFAVQMFIYSFAFFTVYRYILQTHSKGSFQLAW